MLQALHKASASTLAGTTDTGAAATAAAAAAKSTPRSVSSSAAAIAASAAAAAAAAAASSELQAQIEACLPPRGSFKERYGAAGTTLDQRRESPIVELSLLLAEAVMHGLRAIAFCKSRKLCELVAAYCRENLRAAAPHKAHMVKVYRGGYSPAERRQLESELHSGTISALAATNALELGIDVGHLDLTLHLGFPGSLASLWQQAGRAGRRSQCSLSIYVCFDGPLDQHFVRHPQDLFGRPIECVQLDPANSIVLNSHLLCAAKETPLFAATDGPLFGGTVALTAAAAALTAAGLLGRGPHDPITLFGPHADSARSHLLGGGAGGGGSTTGAGTAAAAAAAAEAAVGFSGALHYTGPVQNPAADISLRTIDPERFIIYNSADQRVLEDIESNMAFYQIYDGAVYLYQGRTYLCTGINMESRVAFVKPANVRWYTTVRDVADIHVTGARVAYTTAHTALAAIAARRAGADVQHQGGGGGGGGSSGAVVTSGDGSSGQQQQAPTPAQAVKQELPEQQQQQQQVVVQQIKPEASGQPQQQQHGQQQQQQPEAVQPKLETEQQQQGQGQQLKIETQQQPDGQQHQQQQGTEGGVQEQPLDPAAAAGGAAAAAAAGVSYPHHHHHNTPSTTTTTTTSAVCESCVITVRFMGYYRVHQGSGAIFDAIDLFLPDTQFETQACYLRLPPSARRACESAGLDFREGVHAASHALLNALPLYMVCNSNDVGTECDNPYDTRFRPERLLLYDKHPGGIGLVAQATPLLPELLRRALQLVLDCPCAYPKGCPRCVQHLDCKNYNAVLSKRAGVMVLRAALEQEEAAYSQSQGGGRGQQQQQEQQVEVQVLE